jgi:hypothetical protein
MTADSGGSNGVRARLWKLAVQELADATGLRIKVCHFPPGTSKWNKEEWVSEDRLTAACSPSQPCRSHPPEAAVREKCANFWNKGKLWENSYPGGTHGLTTFIYGKSYELTP